MQTLERAKPPVPHSTTPISRSENADHVLPDQHHWKRAVPSTYQPESILPMLREGSTASLGFFIHLPSQILICIYSTFSRFPLPTQV